MNPAVFVDRDNTLIHNEGDLGDPDQVRLIQGAASAIASLCGLGYRVVVVTNQGGVARGKYREADVEAVHQRIGELITQAANGAHIERFYYCPFHPQGTVKRYAQEHPNRKPAPGMLQQAARDLDLDLSQSWMIGDQMRDIHAGIAAGTRTILVRPDADSRTLRDFREAPPPSGDDQSPRPEVTPGFLARNMVEAVRIIAQQRKPDSHEDARRAAAKRWDAAAVARVQKQATEPKHGEPSNRPKASTSAPRGDAEAPDKEKRKPARPFRPIGVPEKDPLVQAQPAKPASSSAVATPSPTAPPAKTQGAEPQSASAPTPATRESAAVEDAPQETGEAAPTPASPPELSPEKTLTLILQELRSQRGHGSDFSYLTVVAIVLQMLAAVCLLGGLWMGAHDAGLFFRWLGTALIAQLATIAMLLFSRS